MATPVLQAEGIITIPHVSDLGARISLGTARIPGALARLRDSRYILSCRTIGKMLFGSDSTHQFCALRLPPGEQMSPRGSRHKTSLDEQAAGAPSCASRSHPKAAPCFWRGARAAEQQEGRSPSATASGRFPATAPGNPSQMEDGALRQRENPGLVSLHKQYVHGFILSAPSCVTTEFGTNQHDWKVVNALTGMKNFQTFQQGAQVGTAHGCGRPHGASHLPQSFLFKPEAAETPFVKVIKAKIARLSRDRWHGWLWPGQRCRGGGRGS